MSATSQLLRQHIGSIYAWIQHLKDDPLYIRLQERGCIFHNGVIMSHPDYNIRLTPFGLECDFRKIRLKSGLLSILYDYIKLINSQSEALVQHAYELDTRLQELEYLLVREQFYPGGKLWWRNANGVWEIEITEVHGYVNPRLDYKIDVTKSTHSCLAARMSLFSCKAFALDPRKDGRYEFR